ncbi:flavodoxin [Romboutsia ilealis]|uniref:Flavodoxin n=1 Tax=Romboutsia faecis TaxID=2764597 RepID=A0ABR7JSK3_9FIRM|nr:flavodoxin [Romboutsia faecis]MRN25586.1 flavodoxin [Romboutsia ilealis]
METIVIYKSKTGFTKRYAEFIAEDLDAEIYELQEIKIEDINKYDTIVYGGGLYAGSINGIDFINKNIDNFKKHKIIVFATGLCTGSDDEVNNIKDSNFNKEQIKNIDFFYLRGGFNFNTLTILDKILMILMKLKLMFKKNLNNDEKSMLNAYDHPVDFVDRKNISKLINSVTIKI